MNILKEFYQWEVEHVGGRTIRQYNDDGTENPSTMIVPTKVVRASILPRTVGLPRHDVGLDPDRHQRFVRRFGRAFEKRCETNIEHILSLYKFAVAGDGVRRVHYSIALDGGVNTVDCKPEDVRSIDHGTPIGDALMVMRLTTASNLGEFLLNMRVADEGKPFDKQSIFYRTLAEKYGLSTPLGWLLATLSMTERTQL